MRLVSVFTGFILFNLRRFDMTPNDIEILIHYYVSPTPHPRVDVNREAIGKLCDQGLMETMTSVLLEGLTSKNEDGYRITWKGRAHIRQIYDLPTPRLAWLDSGDEIILIEPS